MKRTLAVLSALAFTFLALGSTAGAQEASASVSVQCDFYSAYPGCTAEADANASGGHGHGHGATHCSDYWSNADCYAGCHGNGIVGGSDCKQHGNGIFTPAGLDGGKGNGGSGGGTGGGGGAGGNGGSGGGTGGGGGLAMTGTETASMALLGAGLIAIGGLAVVSSKRRQATDAS